MGQENTAKYADLLDGLQVTNTAPTSSLNTDFALPTDALPDNFIKFCQHVAECRCIPVEAVVMMALTTAGAAIGANIRLDMGGNINAPLLWTMIIAESGAGKTAPFKDITAPIDEIYSETGRRYKDELNAWRAANPKNPNAPDKPKKQLLKCSVVSESELISYCDANERGGIMLYDELEDFFLTVESKAAVKVISLLNRIFFHDQVTIQTKSYDDVPVNDFSFIAMLGNVQPETLKSYASKRWLSNGFLHRFCVVNFPRPAKRHPRSISEEWRKWWSDTIHALRQYGNTCWTFHVKDGSDVAQVVEQEFDAFQEQEPKIGISPDQDRMAESYGKLNVYAHRMALIALSLRIVENANGRDIFSHGDYEMTADIVKWAYSCVPFLAQEKASMYNAIVGKSKPRPIPEIIRELAAVKPELNRSKLAEALGVQQPYISACINGRK